MTTDKEIYIKKMIKSSQRNVDIAFEEGIKHERKRIMKLLHKFPFQDYTDWEIGEDIKRELKHEIK
jgi:hypothetical protein